MSTPTYTCEGSFRYQGRAAFCNGLIGLLVSLQVSGVRLVDLNAYDGGGVFVERGTVTFKVSGSKAEVEKFRTAYNAG